VYCAPFGMKIPSGCSAGPPMTICALSWSSTACKWRSPLAVLRLLGRSFMRIGVCNIPAERSPMSVTNSNSVNPWVERGCVGTTPVRNRSGRCSSMNTITGTRSQQRRNCIAQLIGGLFTTTVGGGIPATVSAARSTTKRAWTRANLQHDSVTRARPSKRDQLSAVTGGTSSVFLGRA